MKKIFKNLGIFLSLFTSSATLICCALPALFVLFGAGASFAVIVSHFPQLIWISKHKTVLFIMAGILLAASKALQTKNQKNVCDIKKKDVCESTRQWSNITWRISALIFIIAICFTYVLPFLSKTN